MLILVLSTVSQPHTNAQKFDRVVETIQDAWDGDANARLSADMVFERIRAFRIEQFGDKTTDSGLDLEVCLFVCLCVNVCNYCNYTFCVHVNSNQTITPISRLPQFYIVVVVYIRSNKMFTIY